MKLSLEPVHFSHLKKMALSPAHYAASVAEEIKDTTAKAFGRLCHYQLLGGAYAVWNGERRAGKEWEAFKAEHEGRDIFKRSEVELAVKIADAVRNDPVAGPLVAGDFEKEIRWKYLDRECSSRIDIHNRVKRYHADLKTLPFGGAKPEKFRWDCIRQGYHAQSSFYQEAARFIGEPVMDSYVIGVEKVEPFAVTVFHISEGALVEGNKLHRLWMERLLQCEAARHFPSYVQSVIELEVGDDVDLIFGDEDEAA